MDHCSILHNIASKRVREALKSDECSVSAAFVRLAEDMQPWDAFYRDGVQS